MLSPILSSLTKGAAIGAIALGSLSQALPAGADPEAQQLIEAMAASTNAALPPGVRGATAGPNILIFHVVAPREAAAPQFADAFQSQSIEFICRDVGMRRLADQYGVTFRVSVEPGGRSSPAIRDITSAS